MTFDPDRWDTPEAKNHHRAAYVIFAMGARGCIGFNFALQENVACYKLFYAAFCFCLRKSQVPKKCMLTSLKMEGFHNC